MRLVATFALVLGWLVADAEARRPTVCAVAFHAAHEIDVFRRRLGPDFDFVEVKPASIEAASAGRAESWIVDSCRPDLQCDVVVLSGEFGGRFFGSYGFSLGLQDLEETSCQARCSGIFRAPKEVFLLACNTLATKDQDSRTPREYLQVLLDHGFDQASAERVVQMRYGPVGPSFRESLRRVFLGVPRIYGFASVAPRGEVTAPMLERYFGAVGDYEQHVERDGASTARNAQLASAFTNTALVQTPGLSASDAGYADRGLVCALYDEGRSVGERLGIARGIMERQDFLAFLPTMQVFLARHPRDQMAPAERAVLADMSSQSAARDEVLKLGRDLEISTLKLEVSHFALLMGWTSRDAFRRLAVDGTKALLARPLTSEIVDIVCEISKHEPVGDAITADDFSEACFRNAEGIRLVDCVASTDKRVAPRIAAALADPDPSTRLWAAHALSRRGALDEDTLLRLARRANDSPEMRERVRWTLAKQRNLPPRVWRAIDPTLAQQLIRPRRY